MKISVDAEKCTGCKICELACSHTKLQAFDPKHACIKVVNLDYWGFSSPVICVQCKSPTCVEACPTQALSQTNLSTIQVDRERCTGCKTCIDECPLGAINWNEERVSPMICDLCGGKPTCVEWCPSGALTLSGGNAIKGKGTRELRSTVSKAKRSLNKLKIPKEVLEWYKPFV